MDDPAFAPGFRFSMRDAVVIIIGIAATIAVGLVDRWTGIAIAFAIGHFFLFCNILRMARPLEICWAVVFATLAVAATMGLITWPIAICVSLLLTIVLAIIEMRRPSYHGIAWQTLNPRLPEWWRDRTTGA